MQARELMKQWWANPDDLPSVPEGVQGLLARMKAINDRGGVRAARNRLQKAKEDLKVLKAKVRSCGSVCAHGLGQLLFIPPKVLRHQQLPVSWQGLYVESDSDTGADTDSDTDTTEDADGAGPSEKCSSKKKRKVCAQPAAEALSAT